MARPTAAGVAAPKSTGTRMCAKGFMAAGLRIARAGGGSVDPRMRVRSMAANLAPWRAECAGGHEARLLVAQGREGVETGRLARGKDAKGHADEDGYDERNGGSEPWQHEGDMDGARD